jgi:hypothetical protein
MTDAVTCDVCDGEATRQPSSGELVNGVTMIYFACETCHEGGHIAHSDGTTRYAGPVFDADRYHTQSRSTRREILDKDPKEVPADAD